MTKPQEVYKYCLKCGSKKFIFSFPNAFNCQLCGFQFFVNAAAAVAAIIPNDKGEILLTKRKNDPAKGTLDIPGGFINIMETAEDATKREILEELNLKVIDLRYLMSVPNDYVFSGISVYTIDLAYICNVETFKSIKINDDVSDYIFMNPTDIKMNTIGLRSIKQIVQYLKENGI